MIEPAQLLQDFGMAGIFCYDAFICIFSSNVLEVVLRTEHEQGWEDTDVFLLLIYVANLEPDVGMSKWARRTAQDAIKAR